MKKQFTFLLVVCTTTFFYAQVHNGDVILETQTDVDSFTHTEIIGNLIIRKSDSNGISSAGEEIDNITNLSRLKTLRGDLKIINNNKLSSLQGLEGLKEITGNLEIRNNALLRNLNGLKLVKQIGGHILLITNQSLTDIDGLSNIVEVNGNFQIQNNNKLRELSGLQNLNQINGNFIIRNNDALINLDALKNIMIVKNRLTIIKNRKLISACGILRLLWNSEAVSGIITIRDNGSLTTSSVNHTLFSCHNTAEPYPQDLVLRSQTEIDAFNFDVILGSLTISERTVGTITSIKNLKGLTRVIGNLSIINNTALKEIYTLGYLRQEGSIGGDLVIDSNPLISEGVFIEARVYFICDKKASRLKVRQHSSEEFRIYQLPLDLSQCADTNPGNEFEPRDSDRIIKKTNLLNKEHPESIILYSTVSNGNYIKIIGMIAPFNYKIFNSVGILIEEKHLHTVEKEKVIVFDQPLISGIYYLRIQTASENSSLQFIVE
ncbi:hypothetical protein [Aquimarina sp. RZ0]|uniref:hypothetical protein n=1 Tax=Aquimarina sp. RZ0 TaxID=2607730 RepID=UPI0011F340C8|nr:hypothetical protein [Aquimarina sp. RZ0]KAA1242144.1 hypothetical protein F0000_26125 [Aquimarina sp. RZ0]